MMFDCPFLYLFHLIVDYKLFLFFNISIVKTHLCGVWFFNGDDNLITYFCNTHEQLLSQGKNFCRNKIARQVARKIAECYSTLSWYEIYFGLASEKSQTTQILDLSVCHLSAASKTGNDINGSGQRRKQKFERRRGRGEVAKVEILDPTGIEN